MPCRGLGTLVLVFWGVEDVVQVPPSELSPRWLGWVGDPQIVLLSMLWSALSTTMLVMGMFGDTM